MEDSSVVGIPHNFESPKSPLAPRMSAPSSDAQNPTESTTNVLIDKTLSGASNLVQLLPSGTVFAFQAVSPSFTNKGECYPSNKYLTYALVILCSLSCIFFSFTDSIKGSTSGKIYYGIATFKGFNVFNEDEDQNKDEFTNLGKYRLRPLDYMHAFLSVIVFLALTFSDSNIQNCLFANPGNNTKELLVNLPIGVAVFASLVFMVFPTSRKGIGYSDAMTHKQSSTA